MFARIVEAIPKTEMLEKREEILRVLKNEILPILKTQHGFLEILPFTPENKNERFITITLWTDKKDAERFDREAFAKVQEIMKPYLTAPMTVKYYTVETAVCEHFEKAMAA
jgi:quinol monooxygenase YgiN